MAKQGGEDVARRRFLSVMAAMGVPLAVSDPLAGAPVRRTEFPQNEFPQNDAARVREIVGVSHSNAERVRELVLEQPALAKASWDWGFGDWETPLGAASHVGRREIAEFLIAHGARPTVFSAAMLGDVDTVRAFLVADPDLHRLHGPHGISLLRHARAGRSEAERVVDYLLDRFGPEEGPFAFPGDADVEARYAGRYRLSTEPPTDFHVAVRNDLLLVGPDPEPFTRVLEVAQDVFHPTGAPAVRLRFEIVEGRARALVVEDGSVRARGLRVG